MMIRRVKRENYSSEKEYLKALNKYIKDIKIHNLNNPDNIIEMSREERLLELKNNLGQSKDKGGMAEWLKPLSGNSNLQGVGTAC